MSQTKNINSLLTKRNESILTYSINIASIFLILISVATSIYMYYLNRGLWLDEAMLAFSLVQRNTSELTNSILDYYQSAPVGYLYLIKFTTLILGVNEFSLRIWSFISYLLVIYFSYFISSRILTMKYPLVVSSFLAAMPFMLRYANEFKPYMLDAALVLLFIIIFYYFNKGKISTAVMCIISAILIWFSSPLLFIIAAAYLYEFFSAISSKDKENIKKYFLVGLCTLASFAIYYFYWLILVVQDGGLAHMWSLKRFPLIPTEWFHFHIIKFIIYDIFIQMGPFRYLILVLFVAMIFLNEIYIRNKYVTIIYLSVFMLMLASWMKSYPMHDRMCLFIYPLIILIFFYCLFSLYDSLKGNIYSSIVMVLLFLVIQFSNIDNGILYYSNKNNIYENDYSTGLAILEEEIQLDDVLLVLDNSFPGFGFEKKYNYSNLPYNMVHIDDYDSPLFKSILNDNDSNTIYIMTSQAFSKPQLDSIQDKYIYSQISQVNRQKVFKLNPIRNNSIN